MENKEWLEGVKGVEELEELRDIMEEVEKRPKPVIENVDPAVIEEFREYWEKVWKSTTYDDGTLQEQAIEGLKYLEIVCENPQTAVDLLWSEESVDFDDGLIDMLCDLLDRILGPDW